MRTALAISCLLFVANAAAGQSLPASVQLPTLQVFTVDTTVSVPDRGGMWLGGIGRRREGRNEFGPRPFASRPGLGVETGASGVFVSATIIDFDELDRQVLARARQESLPLAASLAEQEQHRLQQAFVRAADDRPAGPASVAEIRQRQANQQDATRREGEDLLERALVAEEEGKSGTAKIYYQMAARRLTGEVRKEALRRLAELRGESRGRPRADVTPDNP
ncbi:MAG: hypothetical protein AB7O62_12375 [Pirellulales bacterium]